MLGLIYIFNPLAQNKLSDKLIILLIMKVCFSCFTAYAKYGGGTGEPNDPYLICTAEQMNTIGAEPNDWDKHFKLIADIDLSNFTNMDFNIIGYWLSRSRNKPFTGVFDGNSNTISNFSYTSTDSDYIGIFGYVGEREKDGTVMGVRLIDPNVDAGTGSCVGSLVGWLRNGTVTACSAEGGIVSGNNIVGGLVGDHGFEEESFPPPLPIPPPYTISNCYSTAVVIGHVHVGGLVGGNGGLVIECYSASAVTGDSQVGGLVGTNYRCNDGFCFSSGILNSYSIGTVTGDEYVGGLVGDGFPEEVIDSFWDIETSGQQTSDGGTGKTTTEMQTANTFLDAGWDFVGETDNGTEDIWWINESRDYPRLWWEFLASSPEPSNGAVDVVQPVILSWIAGGSNLYHDIYFGEDEQSVSEATTQSLSIYCGQQPAEITTYDLGALELGKTYYWRIDECSNDVRISNGNVWNFTTANFLVIDDFEDYLYPPNELWRTWTDGWDIPTNGSTLYVLSDIDPCFELPKCDDIPDVFDGRQSMAFYYENSFKYSESTKTLVWPRDWTQNGIRILSLWFHGHASNATEWMCVSIANANGVIGTVRHDDPNAVLIDCWTEWTIDLTVFSDQGVDLTDVDTISIGFGDKNNPGPGGEGRVFFDDIRLYRPPALETTP
jgi:hypothetical protein